MKIKIWQDEGAENPRDWDNLGTMICFHRNYTIGDENPWRYPEDFDNWMEENDKNLIYLPIYMYEHSGITLRTSDFHDRFDSGQLGYIYVEKSKIYKEFGKKRISAKLYERVLELLRSEVKVESMWANGECYGFTIEDENGEWVDSCGGFLGSSLKKSGMYDYFPAEFKEELIRQIEDGEAWE